MLVSPECSMSPYIVELQFSQVTYGHYFPQKYKKTKCNFWIFRKNFPCNINFKHHKDYCLFNPRNFIKSSYFYQYFHLI